MKQLNLSVAIIALVVVFNCSSKAQLAYSPFVDSISQLADTQSVLLLTRQLTGDTTITIGGQVETINSRHFMTPGNRLAAQFIYERFQAYGLAPVYQYFNDGRGINVIATKQGSKYPGREFIICAHYDNMPEGAVAPGADDNASGTVAVLEAARILCNINIDYTVRFAAWDEEEIGLVGSSAYAQQAFDNHDTIVGVINLDMIAWDSDYNMVYSISTNTNSNAFSNTFVRTTGYYQPQLTPNFINTSASDHSSFWAFGYPAFLVIEDWYDFNALYHTVGDDIPILNMDFFIALTRASIANLASNALDQRISFEHDSIISSNSTEEREATVVITSPHQIASGSNQPRLYYSTDSITFYYLEPYQAIGDTFKFMIPGFSLGTVVSYYFAAQDSLSTMISTYPVGGRGISPPGTEAPAQYFSYSIDNFLYHESCSINTPIAIPDNSTTYDVINVMQNGRLADLDVLVDITHPRTQELSITLISPTNTSVILSDQNGGYGDNYTQTIFDDQASTKITNGTPPFTGSFRPEFPLYVLNNKEIAGQWKLCITESGMPNSGMLNTWCLHFLYKDTIVGITHLPVNQISLLGQNYPNPTFNSTNIIFRLDRSAIISLVITDIHGQIVRTLASGAYKAGDHLIVVPVTTLKPGTYFYTLRSGSFVETKQMVIIR